MEAGTLGILNEVNMVEIHHRIVIAFVLIICIQAFD